MDDTSSRNARSPHANSRHQKHRHGHQRNNADEQLSLRRNVDCNDEDLDPPDSGNFPSRSRGGGFATPAKREDWDDAATAVTGATSEFAYSIYEDDQELPASFRFARYSGPVISAIIGILAFVSPIIMVVLPKVGIGSWNVNEQCGTSCESILIGLGFRLLLLAVATCALFLRSPRSTMPRIFVFRALIVFLVFVLMFTFWLFYVVRVYFIFGVVAISYDEIAVFATSLADALLFVHYLAVILIELRQLEALYVVKMTRSPDGETRSYSVGRLSIQRLAVWCLEQYYRDFKIYNPYLDSLPHRAPPRSINFKVYDIDAAGASGDNVDGEMSTAADSRHRDMRPSERVYEEQEYERRVARRQARLLTATEDAFTLIRRQNSIEQGSVTTMCCTEAAQAIFPTLERPLRKFLRVTRQQPWHSRDSVIEQLALCIRNDMSARAFLQPYLKQTEVVWSERDSSPTQTWTIVCDQVVSRSAEHGTVFQLCQGDVTISVAIRQIPHFFLRVASLGASDSFMLRFDSETSV